MRIIVYRHEYQTYYHRLILSINQENWGNIFYSNKAKIVDVLLDRYSKDKELEHSHKLEIFSKCVSYIGVTKHEDFGMTIPDKLGDLIKHIGNSKRRISSKLYSRLADKVSNVEEFEKEIAPVILETALEGGDKR